MNKFITFLFATVLFISCHSDSELSMPFSKQSQSSNEATTTEAFGLDDELNYNPPQSNNGKKSLEPATMKKGSKIIKTGNMHIRVEDLTSAKAYIDSLVSKNNAYYEKETFRNSEYTQNYSLKLRIPSSHFGALVSELEIGGGIILEKNINAKDVTEEFLDLEIRLENNRAYLKRYKELLVQAKSIKDMIDIQEKIRQIELLIDGSLGRMKYLADQVNYSTLTIELTTKPKEYIAESPSFLAEIVDAFKSGFKGLLYFILMLANLWPLLLSIVIFWMFRKKMFGFFKLKKKSEVLK